MKRGKRVVRGGEPCWDFHSLQFWKEEHPDSGNTLLKQNTVLWVKKRYLSGGKASALHEAVRSGQPKKYGNMETAEIITLACSSHPRGKKALYCSVDS